MAPLENPAEKYEQFFGGISHIFNLIVLKFFNFLVTIQLFSKFRLSKQSCNLVQIFTLH